MRNAISLLAACITLLITAANALATDWPQFGYDAAHSGNNTAETAITVANVSLLTSLYTTPVVLSAKSDGAPVYAANIAMPGGGSKNLLFIFASSSLIDMGSTLGTLFAIDASNGTVAWSKTSSGSSQHASSSPAIDASRQFVYSFGVDGYLHKYAIGSGIEVLTPGPTGWPQRATFKPDVEKVASGLTLVNVGGTLYLHAVTDGYNGDGGDYQGHLVSINLVSGAQTVFNVMCSNVTTLLGKAGCPSGRESGMWGRGGATFDATTNRLYITTGNGQFNANTGGTNWGDSVLALSATGGGNGKGQSLDNYTPTNFQQLDDLDADLGSVSLAILAAPAGSTVAHIGLQTGKDAKLRLINLDDMSATGTVFADGFDGTRSVHVGGELQLLNIPQGGEARAVQPAVWINSSDSSTWTFVGNESGLSALKLGLDVNNRPKLSMQWSKSGSATSPIVANNVLYSAGSCASGTCVTARDPVLGNTLWTSDPIGGVHWQSPILVNGALYITDNNGKLWKFGLN